MEKRFALALALSFLFFVVWGKMFPGNVPTSPTENTKPIENKEVASTAAPKESLSLPEVSPVVEAAKDIPEKISSIENEKNRVFISNVGARIIKAEFKEYGGEAFFISSGALVGHRSNKFEVVSENGQKIVLIGQFKGIKVTKSYEISKNDYTLVDKTEVSNETGEDKIFGAEIEHIYLDGEWLKEQKNKEAGEKKDVGRDRNLLEYSIYSNDKVLRKTGAVEFKESDAKKEIARVGWYGYRNRYFCFIARPDYEAQGFKIDPINKNTVSLSSVVEGETLRRGETAKRDTFIYIGPQKAENLEKYDGSFEKIQVYFRSEFFDAIAKIIQDTVVFFYKGIPNWGVCIILVSVLIYGLMYPLTFKSLLSMKKMQSLQPKIQSIREKYEDNPQKLNQEIMKLYKENRINPLGGCLPIFLQMPIFIGLYQVLWRSVWFKGAGFLWIKDLSEPDRLMVFEKQLPILGWGELNILPLIVMVLMFVQQKMSTKNMAPSTDPNQIAQQKMMTTLFPLLLGFMFYKLASGLSLYFTVFYILSIVSQMIVAQHMKNEG